MTIETFGKRICRLRKQVNMTQRELANLLGISEPAVCKWETDSSMPDVMLLAPLARALRTDLNTLFLYEEILSPEKVKELADSAEEAGRTNGTEAGMQYWKEVLQEYPNSELLQMTFAKWLMKLQVQRVATKEQLTKLEDLLVKLCKSEELEISTEAKRYLASFYIQNQRYGEAENMLDALSEFDFNARHLRALLLYVQKNYEAATKEAEQFLFECVQNALICLSRLAGVAVAIEDAEKERTYAEMMCRLEEEFGIPFYRGAMQMRDFYLRLGEKEQAARCLEAYKGKVTVAEEYFKKSLFFGDLGEELRFISNGALVTLKEFREEVLRGMQ